MKRGDVVTLKSGGSEMTVVEEESPTDVDKVECGYFDKDGIYRYVCIYSECLRVVS